MTVHQARWSLLLFGPLLAGSLFAVACAYIARGRTSSAAVPGIHQSEARVHRIAGLSVQRSGRVSVKVFHLDRAPSGPGGRVAYSLSSPAGAVADTDIRGFLDGMVKYPFNQATSFHMRLGRRFGGAYRGRFELKRTLVRWELPELPAGAQIQRAALRFFVEADRAGSPQEKGHGFPLHVYAYPLDPAWGPGRGGVGGDSFSAAAPGEASWLDARAGELPWPAPGALPLDGGAGPEDPHSTPLAAAAVRGGGTWIELSSDRLRRYTSRCLAETRTLDLVLKLDREEEDRTGTEIALLSSEFGDDKDCAPKRPCLELAVEVPAPSTEVAEDFVLAGDRECVLPPVTHPGERVLIAVEVEPRPGELAPAVWVRGGSGDPAKGSGEEWVPLLAPLMRRWDWSQIKLSLARNVLGWGEPFALRLLETWVRPGPREAQSPEAVFIAPSGTVHRAGGAALPDFTYRVEFTPDEIGLWRYGWSFRPTPTHHPGSHEGEGIFEVRPRISSQGVCDLERLAGELAETLRDPSRRFELSVQYRINMFMRWAARCAERGILEKDRFDALVAEVQARLDGATGRATAQAGL